MTRKMPKPTNRIAGPTLLMAGNRGLRVEFRNGSMFIRKWSIKTIMTEPMTGPSIVPNPPITDIIRGIKELSAENMEMCMNL
jgi:hypothetical protein